jgi:hypothetical protein
MMQGSLTFAAYLDQDFASASQHQVGQPGEEEHWRRDGGFHLSLRKREIIARCRLAWA